MVVFSFDIGKGRKDDNGTLEASGLRVWSYNIRTLKVKLTELVKILTNRNIIMSIQQTKWVGKVTQDVNSVRLWYSVMTYESPPQNKVLIQHQVCV